MRARTYDSDYDSQRYMLHRDLQALLCMSGVTMIRWRETKPGFPQPHYLSYNRVAYKRSEVAQFIASCGGLENAKPKMGRPRKDAKPVAAKPKRNRRSHAELGYHRAA